MSRGRVKTILLTMLVICSFLFAAQNWFGEGLWPQGQTPIAETGFFSFLDRVLNRSDQMPLLSAYSALSDPKWIVANRQGTQKELFYADAPAFSELNQQGDALFAALFQEGAIRSSSVLEGGEAAYRDLLRIQSLRFRFRTAMPVDLFCKIQSLPESHLENIQVFRELLFLPGETAPNTCVLAVVDDTSKIAMTFKFDFDPDHLRTVISKNVREDAYLAYAFEIHLGQENSGATLSPMTALSMDQVTTPVLGVSTLEKPISDMVLPLFQYNPNTPKRYTEADDSQVFLDRRSQLRITPKGLVDFKSDNIAQGLALGESTEAHAVLQDLLNLAESIERAAFDGTNQAQLYITSDLTDLRKVTMDYAFGGRPIRQNGGPAVVAEFEAGQLVSYRQQLRKYSKTGETATASDVLTAIDALFENPTSQTKDAPLDIRLFYQDTLASNKLSASWAIWQ